MGPGKWHDRITEYMLVQHTTPCQVTNRSLAKLLMGRRLRTILDRLQPRYVPAKPLDSGRTSKPFGVGDKVYARNYGVSRYGFQVRWWILQVHAHIRLIWDKARFGDVTKTSYWSDGVLNMI